MKKSFLFITLLSISLLIQAQTTFIPFNDSSIFYEGRIRYQSDAAILSWTGTSVSINFEGTSISAVLLDSDTSNYYNAIIDSRRIIKIHTDTVMRTYLLASGLSSGKHKVQLFKRTEWDKGQTTFYGFVLPADAKVLPADAPKKRSIEFYGNSISCAYAIEDSSGKDSGLGVFENAYLSYAAITARHFNAELSCISKSGIGVMVSWFPLIMPEMYDRLDPTDSLSKWDFSQSHPDIVVIHLLQNDSWLVKMPTNEQFKYRFGSKAPDSVFIVNAYKSFVSTIRGKYPDTYIICLLGNASITKTTSHWPGYVKQAVAELNDPKILTHFFKCKNSPGHPRIGEHKTMAADLIDFIERNIQW